MSNNKPRIAGTLTPEQKRMLDQMDARPTRKAKVNASNEETKGDGLTPEQRRILEENTRVVANKRKGSIPKGEGDKAALRRARERLYADEAECL